MFTNNVKNCACIDVPISQQSQVATHFREAGKLVEFRQTACGHLSQDQLEHEYRTIKAQRFCQFRMNGTQETDFTTIALDASSLTGMQSRVLTCREGELTQRASKTKHRFHVRFHVEEIDGITALCPAFRQAASANHTGKHRLLLETLKLADETQSAFEHANAILLTVEVMLQRPDQTRPQRGAHGCHVVGDRIGQQQRLNARIEEFEQLRINEAIGDRFLIATGNQQTTQLRQIATRFSLGLRCQAGLRVTNRQVVITVQTRQLFDQVDFKADVETVTWHFNAPLTDSLAAQLQAQSSQKTFDFSVFNDQTEHLLDTACTQGHGSNRWQVLFADRFDDRTGFTAGDFQQQASSTLHGFTGKLPVHTTLVTVRGIGVQAIGTSLAGHRNGVEESTFQEDIASLGGNAAVLATHDASDGQGALVVGNDQGVGTQADFLTVEQDQFLALLGHAHTNPAIDFGQIEGMQRLTQLQHDVVGDIDSCIDAAHVRTTQTLYHPQRSRTRQVDVANHTPQVTWAGSRCQQLDRTHFVMHGSHRRHVRTSDLGRIKRADFTSQTGNRQAVATVRCQVDFDAGIVQLQVNTNVLTHWRIGRQLHQAIVTLAQLKFGSGTQHAVGLDTAQLGLLDLEVARKLGTDHCERNFQTRTHVRRATYDLQCFAAIADLTNAQLVSIGVLLGAKDFAYDHTGEDAGGQRNAVNLKTGHRQTGNQLIAGNLRAYPATQPLFTEFHPALLIDSLRACVLAKLRQEPQVVVEEQAQIIDAVTQHCQTLDTHAESKALELFRVDAGHAQHVRVDHSAAHDFQPAGLLADATALAAAHHAFHIDFSGRLGEREERRTETHRQFFLEEHAQELFDGAFQIRKVDIAVDQQAFDLVEHRRVGDIRITAVYTTRADDADRRLLRLHGPHLHRRGVGT
ncbi:hypothetical protein ALQ47_05273 [Pseudomonas cichorii]|nr:hypothetical protein ALQ47_05273 [Pseudomonas cichorii]